MLDVTGDSMVDLGLIVWHIWLHCSYVYNVELATSLEVVLALPHGVALIEPSASSPRDELLCLLLVP